MDSLRDFFEDELKDVFSEGNQPLKALPKMVNKATTASPEGGFYEPLGRD